MPGSGFRSLRPFRLLQTRASPVRPAITARVLVRDATLSPATSLLADDQRDVIREVAGVEAAVRDEPPATLTYIRQRNRLSKSPAYLLRY